MSICHGVHPRCGEWGSTADQAVRCSCLSLPRLALRAVVNDPCRQYLPPRSLILRIIGHHADTAAKSWRRPTSKSFGSCAGVIFTAPVPNSMIHIGHRLSTGISRSYQGQYEHLAHASADNARRPEDAPPRPVSPRMRLGAGRGELHVSAAVCQRVSEMPKNPSGFLGILHLGIGDRGLRNSGHQLMIRWNSAVYQALLHTSGQRPHLPLELAPSSIVNRATGSNRRKLPSFLSCSTIRFCMTLAFQAQARSHEGHRGRSPPWSALPLPAGSHDV